MNTTIFLAWILLMAPAPQADRLASDLIQRDSIVAESVLTLAGRMASEVSIPDEYTAEHRNRPPSHATPVLDFATSSSGEDCSPRFLIPIAGCEEDHLWFLELLCEAKQRGDWGLVQALYLGLEVFGCPGAR